MEIKTYTTTVVERNLAKFRLSYLIERKEALYVRYCSPHSPKIVQNGHVMSDKEKTQLYINAITTPDAKTGLSLDAEIQQLVNEVDKLDGLLMKMNGDLKKLTGVEFQLYRAIVLDGKKPTEAVRSTAERCYMSESNVWKNYYPKISDDIERIDKAKEGKR